MNSKKFAQYPYEQITNIQLEQHNIPWFPDDDVPQLEDGNYIVNHRSEHWTFIHVQYPDAYSFCSYGGESKYHDRPYKTLMTALKKQGFKNVYGNDYCIQYPLSYLCGYLCVYLYYNFPKTVTPEKFDKLINKLFGTQPNEKTVFNVMKCCKLRGFI